MDIKDIVVDASRTYGNTFILKEVKPHYAYVDNKKTDNNDGYVYVLVCAERGLVISVRIDGKCRVDQAKIGTYPRVEVDDLCTRLYQISGKVIISNKAKNLRII